MELKVDQSHLEKTMGTEREGGAGSTGVRGWGRGAPAEPWTPRFGVRTLPCEPRALLNILKQGARVVRLNMLLL